MSHSYGGDVVIVRDGGDYRPYEIRIAELEGELRGVKKGYEQGIEELFEAGMKNKKLAAKNAVLSNVWYNTVQELIAKGNVSKEEANTIAKNVRSKLSSEDKEYLNFNIE